MRAASSSAARVAPTLAMPLAGDVVGGAVRGRADRKREAAHQRDAAIETHQLHRDLALVVIHRHDRVEVAASRAHEHRVGRERARRRATPSRARRFDGRRDDVDLLAAEVAAVAGVRIEPGDRDARRCEVRPRACDRSVSRIASHDRARRVISAATADSGTCDVTRAFQRPSRMLNSLAGPLVPSTSPTKPISSS